MSARTHKTKCRRANVSALLAAWLIAALASSGIGLIAAPPAEAAVPGAAPSNPTTPCTWNWNRWTVQDNFSLPYTDNSYDPTQAIFSQAPSALGPNGWYEASRSPQFSYAGLEEGVGPAEEATGDDSEWSYGVGYYVLAPRSTHSITISDPGKRDAHAFAFYDSSGNQFDRFPSISSVQSGEHYIASEQDDGTDPSQAGGIARSNAWSASFSFTVPSDGIVYIHYLHFDENRQGEFASFGGACGPSAADDTSIDNVPASAATLDVTENDSGVDPNTVAIVGADAQTGELVVSEQGTWSVVGGGRISFTPEPGFVDDPAPIRYTATDTRGNPVAPTTVTVDYQPVFSTPDDSLANPTGEPITVSVITNDSNVDARTISILGVDGETASVEEEGRGVWSVDRSAGTIVFTPDPDVEADPRPIQYVVHDVGGNELPPVQVRVSFAPELGPDEALANESGEDVTIDVLENDLTFDIDPSTVQIVRAGANSTELTVRGEGLWSVDPTTFEIVFTPDPGFVDDPTPIRYTLQDIDGNVAPPAEIIIDYRPIAVPDQSLRNPAGFIISLDLVGNDPTEDIDPTTLAIDDPRYNAPTRTLFVPGEGHWTTDAVSGAITFTPQPGFRQDPTPIAYTVEDDDGNVSLPAQVTITYLPVPMSSPDQSLNNPLGSTVRLSVFENDPSAEDLDLTTLSIIGANPETGELEVAGEGTWSIDRASNQIVFVPRLSFEGNPRQVNYIASDARGVTISPTSVTVTYSGAVIPEAIAFVEPVDTDWRTTGLLGALVAAMFGGLWFLARPTPPPMAVPRVTRRG